jgi:NADH:ubiquinone oxidoreductase subunit C
MLHIGLSDSLSIHDMSGFQFVNQTLGESEKLVAAYHFRSVTHLYDIHVSCLLMEYQARNAGLMLSVYK